MFLCGINLSSDSSYLEATGSEDGELRDGQGLKLLDSEYGGNWEAPSYYDVGCWREEG